MKPTRAMAPTMVVAEVTLPWRSREEEQRVHALLKAAGLRPTAARICALQILLGARAAFTAQALYHQLVKAGVEIHLSSIYRALGEMEKSQVVLRDWEDCIGGKKAAYRISPETGRDAGGAPRCDVRCRGCGRHFSTVDHGLAGQLSQLLQGHGLSVGVNPVTIELTCNACAQSLAAVPA